MDQNLSMMCLLLNISLTIVSLNGKTVCSSFSDLGLKFCWKYFMSKILDVLGYFEEVHLWHSEVSAN